MRRLFQKGHSGNPKGRPKGQLATIMAPVLRRALLAVQVRDDGEGGTITTTNRNLIVAKLMEMCVAGDLEAIKFVTERVDGKVPNPRPKDEAAAGSGPSADDLIRAIIRQKEWERERERPAGQDGQGDQRGAN